MRFLEETRSAAEEERNDVDFHFVDEDHLQVLLRDVGAASEVNVFAARGVLRLLECRLNPIGQEMKSCPTLHLEWIASMMREHKDGRVEGRVLSPPTAPRILSPGTG